MPSRRVRNSKIKWLVAERPTYRTAVCARLDNQKHRLPRRAVVADDRLRSALAQIVEKRTAEDILLVAVDMRGHLAVDEPRAILLRAIGHDRGALERFGGGIERAHMMLRITIEAGNARRHHPMHVARSEEHTSELQSLMRISYAG